MCLSSARRHVFFHFDNVDHLVKQKQMAGSAQRIIAGYCGRIGPLALQSLVCYLTCELSAVMLLAAVPVPSHHH